MQLHKIRKHMLTIKTVELEQQAGMFWCKLLVLCTLKCSVKALY